MNRQPIKYWEVKAKAHDDKKIGELLLYGNISNSNWWGDEVTPKQIDADLKALGDIDTLNVYVNSGGGSVFAGQAIYNIIKRHPAKEKYAHIDGLAASIASLIPLSCDKVFMPKNAMYMVHNPWAYSSGNASDFRKMADTLDIIRESILAVYEEKTEMKKEELIALLDAETWMTADKALEYGFVDELQEEKQIAASIDGDFLIFGDIKVDTSGFKNFESIKEKFETYRDEQKPHQPIAILKDQEKEFNRIKNKLLGGN